MIGFTRELTWPEVFDSSDADFQRALNMSRLGICSGPRAMAHVKLRREYAEKNAGWRIASLSSHALKIKSLGGWAAHRPLDQE